MRILTGLRFPPAPIGMKYFNVYILRNIGIIYWYAICYVVRFDCIGFRKIAVDYKEIDKNACFCQRIFVTLQ